MQIGIQKVSHVVMQISVDLIFFNVTKTTIEYFFFPI